MSEVLNIEALQEVIKPVIPNTEICTVVSVDEDSLTIVARPLDDDEADYADVSLSVDSDGTTYFIPSVGSLVLVSELEKDSGEAYVSQHSVPEKYVMLGGDFGGLVKINNLLTVLNGFNEDIQTIKNAFISAPVVGGDGGSSFKAGLISATAGIIPQDTSDLENENITHGGS
jgi:hypothetical protein